MKTCSLILLLTSLSSPVLARDSSQCSDLEERVRRLEIIVGQLQGPRPVHFSCLLHNPLGGTFHDQGDTMLEAKAKTMNACEKSSKAFCDEDKLVCEKSDI